MKKYLLSLLLATVMLPAVAQITIMRSDFGNIGDFMVNGHDSSISSLTVGSGGAAQNWDFSSTITIDEKDTSRFLSTSWFPNAPAAANLTLLEREDTIFMDANSNSISVVIDPSQFGTDFPFSNVLKVKYFSFPTTYLSAFLDSSALEFKGTPEDIGETIPGIDSIMIKLVMYMDQTCDGYGSLKPAAGIAMIDSTLRIHQLNYSHNVFSGKGTLTGGMWVSLEDEWGDSSETYLWMAKNAKIPVLSLDMDAGQVTGASFLVSTWYNGLNESFDKPNFELYPNPAKSTIHIRMHNSGNEKSEIAILDLQGRIIKSFTDTEILITQDISDLNSGIYFIQVRSGEQVIQQKLVVSE